MEEVKNTKSKKNDAIEFVKGHISSLQERANYCTIVERFKNR